MSQAETTHQWILSRISEGRTIYFTTALRTIAISPRTFAKWEKSGRKLFKIDDDGLRIANGKRFDLVATKSQNLCKVSAI